MGRDDLSGAAWGLMGGDSHARGCRLVTQIHEAVEIFIEIERALLLH